MSKQIVEINFNYTVPRSDLENAFRLSATPIANAPGLIWKIWVINEAEKEAAGVYLFEDESSARNYVMGEIVTELKASPAVRNASVKQFGILEELTKVTRGPITRGLVEPAHA
jgi:hypothetical protein